MMYLNKYTIISALAVLLLPSCADDKPNKEEPSQIYADEYYSGGKLGTSFNHTASAYEQFSPAVEDQGLVASFKRGERIFESPFDTGSDATQPMRGLGPLWVRTSCIACSLLTNGVLSAFIFCKNSIPKFFIFFKETAEERGGGQKADRHRLLCYNCSEEVLNLLIVLEKL